LLHASQIELSCWSDGVESVDELLLAHNTIQKITIKFGSEVSKDDYNDLTQFEEVTAKVMEPYQTIVRSNEKPS
jgi:hypothetical protein